MDWISRNLEIIGDWWVRFRDMDDNRLNKRIFKWCVKHGENRCKNWFYNFEIICPHWNLTLYSYTKTNILRKIQEKEFELFKQNWSIELNNVNRANGGQSKLRTYRIFKSEYQSESYITANLPVHHRSALAKFKCGVAPIRIELGRYESCIRR